MNHASPPGFSPLCLILAAMLILPLRVGAQLRGHVVDANGVPLSGALVEIWSLTARLAGELTDQGGGFDFRETAARDAAFITVRRVGYRPARVVVTEHPDLTIALSPFAQTLPAVTVNAPSACPNVADAEARAVWETMRDRYQAFKPDGGVWSAARMTFGRISATNLGAVDTAAATEGQVAAGGSYFETVTQTVTAKGYATSYQGLRQERFDTWEYPRLESFFAGHFLDSVFGALHRFSFESRTPLVLAFCPRSTKRPSVHGTLEFARDSSLSRATWVFQTPAPHEEAGGEVIFAPPASGTTQPMLLPVIGLFWRKIIFDYYQEWMQFEAWHSCQDVPSARFCH